MGSARQVYYLTRMKIYDEDPDALGAWLDGWRPKGFHMVRAKAVFDR
jgi:hypothetical protein